MDITPDKRGSFESYVIKLAERLEAAGWRSVAGFWGRPAAWLEAELRRAGAELIVLSEQPEFAGRAHWPAGLARDLRQARLFRRLARVLDPAVVHLHFCVMFSLLPFALRLGGARNIVFTEHISLPIRRRAPAPDLAVRLRNGLCMRVVSRVLPVSDFVRRRLVESDHVPPQQATVLYNGVDLSRFQPRIESAAALRARLGFPAGELVTCVAQLIDAKGLDYLIDAAARLRERRDLVFLIVGDGDRRQALADQVRRLKLEPSVRLLGQREDVDDLLAASDLFVCPSVWDEALGFVNLEAMAAGLPVVATRMGGIPEAVRDGETGLLVPPRDAAALAAAIASLLDDPARRGAMGRAGRRWVEQMFSIERAIDDTFALYCDLAGEAPVARSTRVGAEAGAETGADRLQSGRMNSCRVLKGDRQ